MPLNLQDLMKKAEKKGLVGKDKEVSPTRPWQEESVFFSNKQVHSEPKSKAICDLKKQEQITSQETIDNKSAINRQQSDNKATTKRQQSDNKAATKRQQSDNKAATKPATNRQQTGNKATTKKEQSQELATKRQQSDNKAATEPATQLATKRQQSDNKAATKVTFLSLVGLQKSLLILIYEECKKARSRTTNPMTLEYMSHVTKTTKGAVKTTLQRLEKKQVIEKVSFKSGRGGWFTYLMPDIIFQEILQSETDNKLATNWQQSDNKAATEPTTKPATTPPVVSSSYINTTTTLQEGGAFKNSLPTEWQSLEYDHLKTLGFTESHLIQIYRAYEKNESTALSADIVQNSIDAFVFDLQHNDVEATLRTPPVPFLVSLLKRGSPYSSKTPERFLTPREQAMQTYLAQEKAKLARSEQLETEVMQLEFSKWKSTLSDTDLLALCPEEEVADSPKGVQKTLRRRKAKERLNDYFEAEIWPNRKTEVMQKALG